MIKLISNSKLLINKKSLLREQVEQGLFPYSTCSARLQTQ
jgi:hypothetical protein